MLDFDECESEDEGIGKSKCRKGWRGSSWDGADAS